MFGAAFFIVFGDVLLRAVLQPEFVAPAHDLIPIFAIAFAFMTMRNFYFAQVIYFTHASYLDLMVSLLFVVGLDRAVGRAGSGLRPAWRGGRLDGGEHHVCIAFMVLGRRWYALPVDFHRARRDAGDGHAVRVRRPYHRRIVPERFVPLGVDGLAFASFGGFAVRRFGLLNATPAVRSATRVRRWRRTCP